MYNKRKAAWLVGATIMMLPQLVFGKTEGTVNATTLNVRSNPSTTSSVVTKVYAKQTMQVTGVAGTTDPWYQVDVKGTKAYIKREFLNLTRADATVTASSLNVRNYPDVQKSTVIGSLKKGTKVDILYKVNGFYKIVVSGKFGFISAQYVESQYAPYIPAQLLKNVGTLPTWSTGSSSSSGSTTTGTNSSAGANTTIGTTTGPSVSGVKGSDVVDTAMKYLGNPYVYGGTSLTNGTDCSGFTQGVMKIHGITIPRTSSDQSRYGTLITRENLQQGDLLFFGKTASTISHCGIYIGDGKMIHASTASTGIIISGAYISGNLPLQVIRRVI